MIIDSVINHNVIHIVFIFLFFCSKEEDIVEDVEAGFPRKKKVKEEVKTTSNADFFCSFQTNVVDSLVVDLCSDFQGQKYSYFNLFLTSILHRPSL
jgi:hypothetical protein